jgi:hypothetical protein
MICAFEYIPQGRPVVHTMVGVHVHEPGEVGQGASFPIVQGIVYLGVGVGVGVGVEAKTMRGRTDTT